MSGFIREICHVVTGRWEPGRLFMMFAAYIDESDTHGPEPDMHMLANPAPAEDWLSFERRFRGLQKDFGFKVLHAVELRTERGEFRGWRKVNGGIWLQRNTMISACYDDSMRRAGPCEGAGARSSNNQAIHKDSRAQIPASAIELASDLRGNFVVGSFCSPELCSGIDSRAIVTRQCLDQSQTVAGPHKAVQSHSPHGKSPMVLDWPECCRH
ncbi:MAG: hypothetical protein ACREHV_10970 [Rhizomicrobium sp.]